MAVVSEQVAAILEEIQCIDFDIGSLKVRSHHFASVAAAIGDCRIGLISAELDAGTYAAYDPVSNVMYYQSVVTDEMWDPWVKSSFVHEAMHVIHDWHQRAWLTRNENEGSCYVAQMVYLLNNVGMIPGGYKKKSAMRNVLDAAIEVAYAITGKPTFVDFAASMRDALPEQDAGEFLKTGGVWPPDIASNTAWKKVVELLGAQGAYPENVGVKSTDCIGIPVRGKIKRVETKSSQIALTIGKKEFSYKWDSSTSFEKANGATLQLGPKDPKLVPGLQAIVVCEKLGDPTYASVVRAMDA